MEMEMEKFNSGFSPELLSEFGLTAADIGSGFLRRKRPREVVRSWKRDLISLHDSLLKAIEERDYDLLREVMFFPSRNASHYEALLRRHFGEESAEVFKRALGIYNEMLANVRAKALKRKSRVLARYGEFWLAGLSVEVREPSEYVRKIKEITAIVRERFPKKGEKALAKLRSLLMEFYPKGADLRVSKRLKFETLVKAAFAGMKELRAQLENSDDNNSDGALENYVVGAELFNEVFGAIDALHGALVNADNAK